MRILNQLLKKEKKRFSVARAKKFWNWFAQNHQAFLFLREVEQQERDRLSSLLLQALHEYNEHLFYQIGGVPGSVEMELIISAEGDIDFFPDVEFLLNQAPTIDPWIFIPFKPPMGVDFITSINEYDFDPHQTIFITLESEKHPRSIGLQICYPDFCEEKKDLFWLGTYLMLDTILGERSAAIDIDYIEIIRTPENICDFDYHVLSEIDELIQAKKRK